MYHVTYKTPHSVKPLRFTFNEINGCIENYDDAKYLWRCCAQDFDRSQIPVTTIEF